VKTAISFFYVKR